MAETPSGLVDAATAARMLGVSLATLYAYVSRGVIRNAGPASDPRARWYIEADIKAWLARKQRQRRPREAARHVLDWGLPVLQTAITRIDQQQLQYRGQDAVTLARHATLEQTAALLWHADDTLDWHGAASYPRLPAGLPPLQRATVALALAPVCATHDAPIAQQQAEAIGLMHTVCHALGGHPGLPFHAALAQGWRRPEHASLLRQALVLCADHELNASTFAVRVAASTGASLAACLQAGLATLSGPRHGGLTQAVGQVINDMLDTPGPDPLGQYLAAGQALPAGLFGHPLYPDGDPRARHLLGLIAPDAAFAHVVAQLRAHLGDHPSLDLALVSLVRSVRLPLDHALRLFAMGRCAGWIAHALEQRATGQLIRPRAEFTRDSE
ncbi:citrate synthase family protein [Silvimonas iriomotensis]|uniref:citrate synthase (unknown stereospecificity) n=1 Tax=Silvimonas iriomotensis TaxID=449662 RepID=A0ABQ2PAS8_9NEIS|nr:citrate synthase family protein [Silvimonas iriomotensis]GGP22074.1 citrate synthase [Silvimonas iriomotensis]